MLDALLIYAAIGVVLVIWFAGVVWPALKKLSDEQTERDGG